ncbi:MAG: FAD-binding oxidoreductase [Gammaproteobacteria bacterium]|nr:FAD-binding oxidoreductase [Gammaproteobacteria bacterium]MDE0365388.1 FAD-binding oxidoreductase [Gammaproteobacteria bacterium]
MNECVDVIVIGGGIAGCSTAYYLAADGVQVTLLERFEPGALASGLNAGSLHAQIPPEPVLTLGESWAQGFAPALPLFIESMALWKEAGATISAELEVSQDGGLVVAANAAEMRMLESKIRLDRNAGLEMELLDAPALRELAPYVSDRMIGGVLCPIEGKANPLVAAPVFAAAALEFGARVVTDCPVSAIRRSGAVFEVESPKGGYRASRLVNAAGAHAGPVAGLAGARLECEPFLQQLIVTERTAPLIDCLIYAAGERLTLKQTKAGTVVIGGGWQAGKVANGLPQVLQPSLSGNLRVAVETVPALASLGMVRTWAGAVNASASWRPLVGEMPGAPGMFVNWVPWMGFSGALAASRVVASQVQDLIPPVDFDVTYFSP